MPDIEGKLSVFKNKINRLPQERPDGVTPADAVVSYVDILSDIGKIRAFADYRTQIDCLDKFCDVSDEFFCRQKLQEVTYFRLKGYILALREIVSKKYHIRLEKTRVSFDTVCRFYECDEQLRVLLLYALQKIEVFLRAKMSYFYAMKYKPYGYLEKQNYVYRYSSASKGHNHHEFLDKLVKSVESNTDKPFVQHYLLNHGGVMPLWAVSELMTFGDLVHFYRNWKPNDRKDFLGDVYPGKENKNKREAAVDRFISWLECCRKLRNVCAHDGQLYGKDFPWNSSFPEEFDQKHFPSTEKLWAAFLAIQFLYPDKREWENWIVPRLQSILDIPAKSETNLLLRGLGFPANWKDGLNIWTSL